MPFAMKVFLIVSLWTAKLLADGNESNVSATPRNGK